MIDLVSIMECDEKQWESNYFGLMVEGLGVGPDAACDPSSNLMATRPLSSPCW